MTANTGSVVAVIGASGGIGRAVIDHLRSAGTTVVAGRGPGDPALGNDPPELLDIEVDVTDPASVERFYARAARDTERLDGLVVAAGVMEQVPFDDLDEQMWSRTLGVNLDGSYRCVRYALPLLRAAEAPSVVLLSSQLAYCGGPEAVAYSASKAGVLGLTRALARDLGPHIRVNAVAPGPVVTPMTARYADRPGYVETKTSRQVIQRFAQPAEVAAPIMFLLSSQASFMTGQTVSPNGGGVMT